MLFVKQPWNMCRVHNGRDVEIILLLVDILLHRYNTTVLKS